MPKHDNATTFSLNYLSVIEDRLKISWDEHGQPICVPGQISSGALKTLKNDLGDLLSGTDSANARAVTEKYGKNRVQTVGFGLAPDFDQFVKLGFLYGERVVLWDFIGGRLLSEDGASQTLKSAVAHAACNLLVLKPVVERGGLVILQHPADWSNLAEQVAADLKTQGNKSAATFGLHMALAAIQEGLPLHPYTLLRSGQKPTAAHAGDLYSPENYIFQRAASGMLNNQELAYLRDVNAAEFHSVVSKFPELQKELRKLFSHTLAGLSEQQIAKELPHLQKDLVKLMQSRNKDLAKYKAEGSEATAIFILSSLTVLSSNPGVAGAWLCALAAGSICTRLWIALRKWLSKPEIPVIVQAFQELRTRAATEGVPTMFPQTEKLPQDVSEELDAEIYRIKDELMLFTWTEERHEYLMSLPVEVARKVLHALDPEDLDRIVNHRLFQEAYIGDYLGDVWEVDEAAFWKHMGSMFESEQDMLIYDADAHVEIMSSHDMPLDVWEHLLRSIVSAHRNHVEEGAGNYFADWLSRIVRFQTTEAEGRGAKRVELRKWFGTLNDEDQAIVGSLLQLAFDGRTPPWFAKRVG